MRGRNMISGYQVRTVARRLLAASAAVLLLAMLFLQITDRPAQSATLGKSSLQMSIADVSATSTYQITFETNAPATVGSIRVQFCANDPFENTSCAAPGGLDISAANLIDQAGMTGFSVSSASTANELVLSRAAAPAAPGQSRYVLAGVTNPSSSGTYYARILTYASTDTSGPRTDFGAIAFQTLNSISITATVPPYLLFCVAVRITNLNCANAVGDFIDFGELSVAQSRRGTSQMLVASNASGGYNIAAIGNTLTSGNNVIAAIIAGDVSRPGTPQFGFNMRQNVAPAIGSDPAGPGLAVPAVAYNQPNVYRFTSGDTVAATSAPDDVRLFTTSYIANIPITQPAGVYVSTITYTCLANF